MINMKGVKMLIPVIIININFMEFHGISWVLEQFDVLQSGDSVFNSHYSRA